MLIERDGSYTQFAGRPIGPSPRSCFAAMALGTALAIVGCGPSSPPADAASDTGVAVDSGSTDVTDVQADAALEAGTDAGADAGFDAAADVTLDAPRDSGVADAASQDASRDAGSDVAMSDGGVACNTLVNSAAVIGTMAGTGTAPVGHGGTIVPGRYVMTSATLYSSGAPPPPSMVRVTLVLSATTIESVSDSGHATSTFTSTPTGGFNFMQTCPTPQTVSATYDATPTTFTLIANVPGFTVVEVFTAS